MELKLKLENKWLEATWTEDEIQIHCESYSGHKEHIEMLKNKALEFGTSLDEYTELIQLCEDSFIYPTDEEIAKEELNNKIAEEKAYLNSTDFYYSRFLETGEVVPEEVVLKRTEAREYIRANTL